MILPHVDFRNIESSDADLARVIGCNANAIIADYIPAPLDAVDVHQMVTDPSLIRNVTVGSSALILTITATRGAEMGYAQKRGNAAAFQPRQTRNKVALQPRYDREISDEIIAEIQASIDAKKPDNFRLTPITEPGW